MFSNEVQFPDGQASVESQIDRVDGLPRDSEAHQVVSRRRAEHEPERTVPISFEHLITHVATVFEAQSGFG